MPDPETVADVVAEGASISEAGRRFELSEDEVRSLLKEAVRITFDAEQMKQSWMLAGRRMLSLELQFFRKAKETGDNASAIVAIEANERRATLSGANAPVGHVVSITAAAAPPPETSTEYYRNLLDNIKGITYRERQLTDRYELDGEDTPELRAELNELRVARGEKPIEPKSEDDSAIH